jgi:hypothetical protein
MARAGSMQLSAAGTVRIGAPSALDGSSFSGHVEGETLSDLAAWGLPESLPADRFTIDGRLAIEDGVYRADGVVATLGADRAGLDGVLGSSALSGLDAAVDLRVRASALARFSDVLGFEAPQRLPVEAYSISGRTRRLPAGLARRRARRGRAPLLLNGIVAPVPACAAPTCAFAVDAGRRCLRSSRRPASRRAARNPRPVARRAVLQRRHCDCDR